MAALLTFLAYSLTATNNHWPKHVKFGMEIDHKRAYKLCMAFLFASQQLQTWRWDGERFGG
jgi:hypothetical protein